ncbi:hypothetical protein CARUB_v10015602mg [Capsella rubella]|uniref:F-box domain-containing protein n=1 Tax=Capsella rubella TaxID=81985 RepID=R0G9V1_9BRAS|nr:putative F-box only protein 15 [Capsella rubella]EOA32336.1 hypothetical protein CARUB_v10015602mg [Capsella rubella]
MDGLSLPFGLVEEILYRTPVESLVRFKATCKGWNALISSDTRFMHNHLDRHSSERFIRIDDDRAVQFMDPVTGIHSETPIPDEFHHPFPVSCMVHCDGLMLCRCEDWENLENVRLAVWNPLLRKIKLIQPLVCYWKRDCFGIGYDKASRDNYKVLRFGYNLCLPRGESYRDYEIYEFKSDSWRGIEAKFDADVLMEWECVSVKGNMYWIAATEERYIILCFDFSLETFKEICACPPFWKSSKRLECYSGDRLSFLTQDGKKSRNIMVWVTDKLSDEVVLFTNYFNVTTTPYLPRLQFHTRPGYFIGKHGYIMAWCEREGVVQGDDKLYSFFTLYEIGHEGRVRKEIVTGTRGLDDFSGLSICSCVYLPSLIPVPE